MSRRKLIVVATVEAASAILLEAALSFLGLGVQPPLPSWGTDDFRGQGLHVLLVWLIAIPGTALALLVLAIKPRGRRAARCACPGGARMSLLVVDQLTVDLATPKGTLHAVARHFLCRQSRRNLVHRR